VKPPHWLCRHCGIIINDSGSEPVRCSYCDHHGSIYLGFEDDYDPVDVRAMHNILFDPEKFSDNMKQQYFEGLSASEKQSLLARIAKQADQVKQRRQEGYGGGLFDD
jgi:hypothetical protein